MVRGIAPVVRLKRIFVFLSVKKIRGGDGGMGGSGSSRWGWHSKRTCVEDCRVLNVNLLRRDGFLRPGVSGTVTWPDGGKIDVATRLFEDSGYVRLEYSITRAGQRQDFDCRVDLVQVVRLVDKSSWVFRCPLNGCARRTVKLYLPPGGRYFGCRECYGLTYRARQEHDKAMDAYRRLPFDELAAVTDQLATAGGSGTQRVRNATLALKMLGALGRR